MRSTLDSVRATKCKTLCVINLSWWIANERFFFFLFCRTRVGHPYPQRPAIYACIADAWAQLGRLGGLSPLNISIGKSSCRGVDERLLAPLQMLGLVAPIAYGQRPTDPSSRRSDIFHCAVMSMIKIVFWTSV